MIRSLWVIAGICLLSNGAIAQQQATREAGDWLVRLGATYISPESSNHPALDVDDALGLTFNGTYMVTNNFGVELLAALPYEHDLDGKPNGSLGLSGKIGSTKHLPPTLSAQWHFDPIGRVIPYLGAGINYTLFFDESTTGDLAGTKLDLDASFGLAGQVGVDMQVNEAWFVNIDLRYIQIESDASVDGAGIGDVDINPWVFGINVGRSF
jgi:outer membrane protein